jgi:hypothetical protein
METVRAEFHRLSDIAFPALIGAVGTYVIWGGRAQARATYLGEGVLLERFAKHAGRFDWPFAGFVAITGDWTSGQAKEDAEILEAILLIIADHTDRLPTHNQAPGKISRVHRILRSHPTLRVHITGFDPLMIPEQARPLASARVATIKFVGEGRPYEMDHPWRLRRRLHG